MKFYQQAFAGSERDDGHGAHGEVPHVRPPHGMIGGMMNKPPEMAKVPPNWQNFLVPDINAAVERIKANGGQILNGTMEVPVETGAERMDPQGAAFSLHARKAQKCFPNAKRVRGGDKALSASELRPGRLYPRVFRQPVSTDCVVMKCWSNPAMSGLALLIASRTAGSDS